MLSFVILYVWETIISLGSVKPEEGDQRDSALFVPLHMPAFMLVPSTTAVWLPPRLFCEGKFPSGVMHRAKLFHCV